MLSPSLSLSLVFSSPYLPTSLSSSPFLARIPLSLSILLIPCSSYSLPPSSPSLLILFPPSLFSFTAHLPPSLLVGKQKLQRWVAKRFCCWCEKCSKSSESSQDAVDRGSGVSLTLFDRKKTKGRNDGANRDDITVSRDSTKLDRSDYEPAKPNFDAAAPTNSQRFAIN